MQEQQVTLNDYIRVLSRGRWIIAISFLVVCVITVYLTFTANPVYEASALVMLKEDSSVQSQVFEVASFMKQETMINNQVEILRSRTLAEEVIRKLKVHPSAESLWVLDNGPEAGGFSFVGDAKAWLVSLLKGGNGNGEEESEEEIFDEIVKNFREGVTVAPKRDTDLIELKIESFNPLEAALVANTWMEAYRDGNISESRGEVSEVRKFLEEKLQDVEVELTASEEELKDYKEQNQVAELTTETQQLIERLANFEALYQEAETDLGANEKRLEYLNTQLDESQKALVSSGLSSPMVLTLQEQLATIIAEKAAYEQQLKGANLYSEDDVRLQGLIQRERGLTEKIREETEKMVAAGTASLNPIETSQTLVGTIIELETENTSLKAKTSALRGIVIQYNRELNRLPQKSLTLARLHRETLVNNNIFMMLREKYEENRIIEAGQIGSVRIVDYAKPSKDPIKPKKKMNLLLGIMVGLGLGVGLTFLKEYMDNSIKTIEELEGMDFTVLGSIPLIKGEMMTRKVKGEHDEIKTIESRLITHFAPKSPISEGYRSLRTNIYYTHIDNPVKTVCVTSSGPGEGKSTTVANLAISFAQMGSKTLLVDTDLRRPVLHGIFQLSRDVGLTNILVKKVSLKEAIKQTEVNGLDVLTSGILPPNPSEIIASRHMKDLLEEMKTMYDIILFDSPPIIAVTDAVVLATQLDGVIVVVKSGHTGRDAILRSRILLQNVNAKVLGVLLNSVDVSHTYGSYQYYQYYHYYGDGKHQKKGAKKSLV